MNSKSAPSPDPGMNQHIRFSAADHVNLDSSNTPDPLCALVEGISRENKGDFAGFYHSTAPRVFALVNRIVEDPQRRLAVMEDTYAEVWRTAASCTSAANGPLTWVLMLARSFACDERRQDLKVTHHTMTFPRRPSTAEGTEPITSHRCRPGLTERRSSSRTPLDDLSVFERECLDQAFLQTRTYPEIAQDLRLPPSTVQDSIRDGMTHLRQQSAHPVA